MRGILVLLAPATLLACDETPNTTAPPTRPSHVPVGAVWRGGADGGNWHRCAIESDVISCTYFQENSDQSYTQKFRLCAQRSVSDWVARMDGVGGANAEVWGESFALVPVGPPVFYDGSRLDARATAQEAESFANADREACGVPLQVQARD